MVIRREQMEALAQPGRIRFTREMEPEVRQVWVEETADLSSEAVQRRIAAVAAVADRHGLTDRHDVSRYVHLAFAFERGDLDQAPWAAAILADTEIPAPIRMDQLWHEARARLAAGTGGDDATE